MELFDQTLHHLHQLLKNRQLSSRELTAALLDRIESVEPQINAFITLTADQAMQDADQADQRIASGDCQTLTGIPVALKDIFMTQGVRTTCASRILENFIAP